MRCMTIPKITIDARVLTRAQLREREWLITNGLGGYASGTLSGDIARRYHGLFVPNLAHPKGRHLMIARFGEQVLLTGGSFDLDECDAPVGQSDAPHFLEEFELEGNVARWVFAAHGIRIERRIFMPHQQNTVCVCYRLLEGPAVRLRL